MFLVLFHSGDWGGRAILFFTFYFLFPPFYRPCNFFILRRDALFIFYLVQQTKVSKYTILHMITSLKCIEINYDYYSMLLQATIGLINLWTFPWYQRCHFSGIGKWWKCILSGREVILSLFFIFLKTQNKKSEGIWRRGGRGRETFI